MYYTKTTLSFSRCVLLLIASLPFLSISAQVNLQTGSAVFSLPVFSWKDTKSRLSSSVALTYSSGNGLKVADLASNVGQGWSLMAGGVVTRMQVGEPDDQPAFAGGTTDPQDITKYPAGYLYATVPSTQGCPAALTRYPIYGGRNILYTQRNLVAEDKQLDYFSFQFNGKAGLFLLSNYKWDHGISLGDNKLIITFQRDTTMTSQGIRTTITSFTIQDDDGLIYHFTGHGLTKVLKADFCDANVTRPQAQPKLGNGGIYHQAGFDLGPNSAPWVNKQLANPYVIDSWYLTEIDEPLTGRKITINYTSPRTINNNAGYDIAYNNSSDNYVIITHKTSISVVQDISSIQYPDGHTVIFNYSGINRADMNGEQALASIDVTYLDRGQTRYVSEHQLNTTYFLLNRYGTPVSQFEKNQSRLCLRSVKKLGPDLKEDASPYIFDYYTGSSAADDFVPPPYFYARDVWGYYNGSNSVKSDNSGPVPLNYTNINQLDFYSLKGLCFQNDTVSGVNLNAKPGYAQNGLLRQIIYPTGGTLTYQYAQNTGSFVGSTVVNNVGGVHVFQTLSTDGGYSNGCSTPVTTQYNYVMNGPGSASSLWGLEAPMNMITSNNNFSWEYNTIHWSFLHCPFGCCLWHFTNPGILSQNSAVDLVGFQKVMEALAPVLGVLTIITDVMDVINVCLDPTPLVIVAVALDIIAGAVSWVLGCKGFSKYTPDNIYYNFDLNGSSSLPGQFKRVEVVENPGSAPPGKTVQEFTSSDDYPIWVPSNPTLSAKQRFAPWAYGLPKRISVYDGSGNLLKRTIHVYDTSFARQLLFASYVAHDIPPVLTSTKCQVILNSSQRSTSWFDLNQYGASSSYSTVSNPGTMNVDIYNYFTGHMEMDSTIEQIYRPGDSTNFTSTRSWFTYDPNNYQVNTISTLESNGDKKSKHIVYSADGVYSPSTLFYNNILNEPIVIDHYLIPVGSKVYNSTVNDFNYYTSITDSNSSYLLSEQITDYAQVTGGDLKPVDIRELRFNQPLPVSQAGSQTYKTIQQFRYDANGNLTGMKDEGSRSVTHIYDYNDLQVSATVVNADPVTDKPAYTSFESGDFSRSGWTLSGTAAINVNSPSVTGSNNFSLLSAGGTAVNSFSAGNLNISRAYTLSFWASNTNVSVSAGTLTKSAPTYNGFTYYEYRLPVGTASVQVSNNAANPVNIDELRLYPQSARMSTTTWDPVIGKTSECDPNNRINYYEYDNLGRLHIIRDESGNIIKMIENNNISPAKQAGCPGSYENHLLTESFTRTNCSQGYLGGSVSYSIPANKYSSTTSQWDADIQAEIDLLTNGPALANTNGSCSLIYYNNPQSVTDTTDNCPLGYKGGLVTFTVPAGTYSSIISQADADQQAMTEAIANGQTWANDPANAVCSIDTAQDWEWTPGDPTYCLSVNGNLPPHLFLRFTDVNPNSPTYLQIIWEDTGPSDSCPANTYFNASQSGTFYKSCSPGYAGTPVVYTVPPGQYSSTVSQAAADQQAINDVNTNGQNYANTNGTCNLLIYAHLTYQNVHTIQESKFQSVTLGDVIVNFYADAAMTQPVSTPNLTFNYTLSDNCTNSSSNLTFTANGVTTYMIGHGVQLGYMISTGPCANRAITYTYTLASGYGYIVE